MNPRAPVLEALDKMAGTLPMHMPGHKRNSAWGPAVSRMSQQGIFDLDFTEVPGLDDLHAPREVIAEAQDLAAQCFGARQTFFLVNGASVGIMAAILASCGEGDKVLVPRNAHRCVYEGLVLSGAEPVYFHPAYHQKLGVPLSPCKEQLIPLIDQIRPRAIILINPTYHGAVCDLSLLEYAREKGIITIVDESHGSHFIFDPRLPDSALSFGADIIVHSTHKTLGSLTQTALLHLGSGRVDPEAVEEALSLLQTTSPSYLLMASLDAMRRDLAEDGQRIVGRSVDLAMSLAGKISEIEGFFLADLDNPWGYDPTKILLQASRMNGLELGSTLRCDFGVFPELEDEAFVLLMLTVGDTIDSIRRLIKALESISSRSKGCSAFPSDLVRGPNATSDLAPGRGLGSASGPGAGSGSGAVSGSAPGSASGSDAGSVAAPATAPAPGEDALRAPVDYLPQMALTPRQAFKSGKMKRPLKDAVGCISGSLIVPYPPGVPLVCPGEGISAEIVEYLKLIMDRGAHVQGISWNGEKPELWVLEC